jgi:tripartite-type tricarboxylate transporter receptor subunit TctC
MRMFTRRPDGFSALRLILASAIALSTFAFPAGAQSGYPDRPVRFVVAFAPGGITDIVARIVGERLSTRLGQAVVIDNKGGAAGELGANLVATSKPDGYTVLITTTALTIRGAGVTGATDPQSQLTPIAMAASTPTIFLAKSPAVAKNLSEFIRGKKDGRLTYASAGAGTAEHLTAAYAFGAVPKLEATHVPYKSGGETVSAALGGHVDLAATSPPTSLAYISDGKLNVLAIATHKRSPMLPDVPTLGELGFMDVENSSWIALLGPPGMPKAQVEKLNAEVNEVLALPELQARFAKLGFQARPMSAPEFTNFIQTELLNWRKIIGATGVVLN